MNKLFYLLGLLILLFGCGPEVSRRSSELIDLVPMGTIAVAEVNPEDGFLPHLTESAPVNRLSAFERLKSIRKKGGFLKFIDAPPGIASLNFIGRNEPVVSFLTQAASADNFIDSTAVGKSRRSYDPADYFRFQNDTISFFTAENNGFFMASSSELVIEEFIRRTSSNTADAADDELSSLFMRTGSGKRNIYLKAGGGKWLRDLLLNKPLATASPDGYWYQLSFREKNGSIVGDGIVTYQDSLQHSLSLYNGMLPTGEKIAEVIPSTAAEVIIIPTAEHQTLVENVISFRRLQELKINKELKQLLEISDELAMIKHGDYQTVAWHLNPELEVDSLTFSGSTEAYRGASVTVLSKPLNTGIISPLLPQIKYTHLHRRGDFAIFSNSREGIEAIISNIQNRNTLSYTGWYENEVVQNGASATLTKIFTEDYFNTWKDVAEKNDVKILTGLLDEEYPALVAQFTDENEFAHLHIAFAKAKSLSSSSSADQSLQQRSVLSGDAPLQRGPWFFKNHLSGGYDVAFQDVENALYLFSLDGKRYWKRELSNPILGNIYGLDTYKNGRFQMAFTTKDKLYSIDRNGRDHASFPLNIIGITEGLALFDYDNNRNYRLLVTSSEKLSMYDATGNNVTGFQYSGKDEIVGAPQHFRVSGKDYITVPTSVGLRIINRVGMSRTDLDRPSPVSGSLVKVGSRLNAVSGRDLISIDPASGDVRVMATGLDSDQLYDTELGALYLKGGDAVINDLDEITEVSPTDSFDISENLLAVQVNDDSTISLYDLKNQKQIGRSVYGEGSVKMLKSGDMTYLLTLEGGEVLIYELVR